MTETSTQIPVFQRLLGLFTILLLIATWGLWSSPASAANPQIPWLSVLCPVPSWVDLVLLSGVILASSLLMIDRTKSPRRWLAQAAYFVCFSGLVLFDQHRLQPWTLQFLLIGAVLTLSPNQIGLRCCRWIVVTVYIYSAISKFDDAFLTGHGQLLLDGLLKPFSIDHAFWPERTRQLIVAMFPIGELATALLLISRRLRRWGVASSCLMHITLLLTLGPLGLDHENGVLLWNLFFIFQNILLFWNGPESRQEPSVLRATDRLTYTLTGIMFVLPILENWGMYDHWPAWAVYSPRPERVRILVDEKATKRFPQNLQSLCGSPTPLDDRVPLLLDRWAFQTRHCPIYPQLRYRLALASALLVDHAANEEVTIKIGFTPDRWTGKRKSTTLTDKAAMDLYLKNFRVNITPRTFAVRRNR